MLKRDVVQLFLFWCNCHPTFELSSILPQTTFVDGSGGGGNAGARDGYELSFYSCDKSSRQKWAYDLNSQHLSLQGPKKSDVLP
jgi:hypothetical protein